MPNRNYDRAAAHERSVRDQYINRGYIAARSAGSHSAFDVYAVQTTGPTHTEVRVSRGVEYTEHITPVTGFAIQCKRRRVKNASNRVSSKRSGRRAKAIPTPMPVQDHIVLGVD